MFDCCRGTYNLTKSLYALETIHQWRFCLIHSGRWEKNSACRSLLTSNFFIIFGIHCVELVLVVSAPWKNNGNTIVQKSLLSKKKKPNQWLPHKQRLKRNSGSFALYLKKRSLMTNGNGKVQSRDVPWSHEPMSYSFKRILIPWLKVNYSGSL